VGGGELAGGGVKGRFGWGGADKIARVGLPRERDLFQRSHHPDGREGSVAEAEPPRHGASMTVHAPARPAPVQSPPAEAERAARVTLRGQIAKLEGEHSAILAERFPFLAAPPAFPARPARSAGPCLPSLGELEDSRDRLAARVQQLRARAARRSEHERRAAELLEKMRLEPGRYRYYRVPVRDLGQGGCGVWEVRPRLGLVGMLAGWWELTLSSGCPLDS
jgi:hypothetical protein